MAHVHITREVTRAVGDLAGRATMISLLLRLREALDTDLATHRRNRDPGDPDHLFLVPLGVISGGRSYTFVFAASDTTADHIIVEAVTRVPPPTHPHDKA